jgi:hypothetical protein
MSAAGLLALLPSVSALPDTFDLLGEGGVLLDLGLLLLAAWVMLGLFGAACLYLAWRMARADRVARGLSYVLLGGLGGSILIGDQHSTDLILVMLACFAAVAVLAAVPRVNEFFAGADAPDSDQPTPIVIARTLVAVWAGCAIILGAVFLPLGGLGDKFVVIGLLLIGLGAGAWYLNGRLVAGDPIARSIVTAGAAGYLIILLVLGERSPGLILPLALVAGVLWNLWIPAAAQRHFGVDVARSGLTREAG